MRGVLLVILLVFVSGAIRADDGLNGPPVEQRRRHSLLDPTALHVLNVPTVSKGKPAPGQRVTVTPIEYAGTDVFHTVYLPDQWTKDGPALPVIFEYTGNDFPQSGCTGEPEGAGLGYCLSDGKFIWVSLPYISTDHKDNAVTWWGDEKATIDYVKTNVPRIIREFGADPNTVILCGFSRGAIGVNYLGLHDDEIARLWTAFVTHDHFDGVRSWGNTPWGSPLEQYQTAAAVRLQRVGKRPYLVSQNASTLKSKDFIRSALNNTTNFTFSTISAGEIFGSFPNAFVKAAHTDRWAIKPSEYRTKQWTWINQVTTHSKSQPR